MNIVVIIIKLVMCSISTVMAGELVQQTQLLSC